MRCRVVKGRVKLFLSLIRGNIKECLKSYEVACFSPANDAVIFGCQVVSIAWDGSSRPLEMQSSLVIELYPWHGMARPPMSPHHAFPLRFKYPGIRVPWVLLFRQVIRLLLLKVFW